jgi:hypothetical protein
MAWHRYVRFVYREHCLIVRLSISRSERDIEYGESDKLHQHEFESVIE